MKAINKITLWQMICMVTISRIMHTYTYLPILLTEPRNQDSWLQIILTIPYSILFSLPLLLLVNKFKNEQTIDMATKIWGKLGGKIFIGTMVIFLFFCGVTCLAMAVSFINNYIFYFTPYYIIMLFVLVPALYISIKGISTIARLSVIIFIVILASIILFFLLGIPQMEFSNLLPIMQDSNLWVFNQGAIIEGSKFSDIIIIFLLYFHLENVKQINKSYFSTLFLSITIIIFIIIPVFTVLGVELATKVWNPYYFFVRQIEVYDFIQRVEIISVIVWFSGVIIKSSIYLYLASYYIAKIFNTRKQPLISTIVAIMIFVTIIYFRIDRTYIVEMLISNAVFPLMASFFVTLMPLFTLIVYWFRKKQIIIQS